MKYQSTRGRAPVLDFEDVLVTGLATDGGLYVPTEWPPLSDAMLESLAGKSYAEVATAVMSPFVGDAVGEDAFAGMIEDCYAAFDHRAVAPLKQIDSGLWVMELFHGPTMAFKDYALQLVGRLFDHILARRGERRTIIGATSGDTGSAAIEACRGRDSVDIFILHPKGRVSEVQRRQMTTVVEPNVHNMAIEGSFDDCQDLVKAMFADAPLRGKLGLSAVNSINWARIMAQIVYYVTAAVALGAPRRPVSFAVPTGNFGNIYAAYAARQMGLPISRLVIGSNTNDILTRTLTTGLMEIGKVVPTLSPSMDIQVSSNFERLIFDLLEGDGPGVNAAMESFRESGRLDLGADRVQRVRAMFDAYRADDEQTLATIARVYSETGELVDPHSAVGIAAARGVEADSSVPTVALSCAHPAKFPDAVEKATGVRPALPARHADLLERAEAFVVLPRDLGAVKTFVRDSVKAACAA